MPETCGYVVRGTPGICYAPAAVKGPYRDDPWLCPAHVTLAPGYRLLTDAQMLGIIGAVVGAAEDECRRGHTLKQDEVSLGLWRQVIATLNRGQEVT